MNPFLKTYRLALTPLSPIHIGCGEDFEPTNYVIDGGVLYGFDPSRAALDAAQRAKLMDAANRASLLGIQRFFKDNAKAFKAQADVLIPVSQGVADIYEQRIGRAANIEASGNQVFNKLEIERHIYTGAQQQPYIPGSSFKGSLRTSWLDQLNDQRPPHDVEFKHNGEARTTTHLETRLLGGDFQTSPLRLLKVADLMPTREPEREVLFAVNRKKKRIVKNGEVAEPKGIAARKDCVLHGQYRLFQADATVPALQAHHFQATDRQGKSITPRQDKIIDLFALARACNTYHQQRLRRELAVLDGRTLVHPDWKRSVERLLAGLAPHLDAGRILLVRLGRYGGADSKTLSGEGVTSIKIMGARVSGKQQFTFESTTKTVWLAAQRETDQIGMLPFGWAVVEIDPQGELPELQRWCADQSRNRPDMAEKRRAFAAEKLAAQQRKADLAAQAIAQAAARQAELQAEQARAQALAQMTPQGQLIETLRQGCEALEARIVNGNFKKQAPDAGKAGLYQEAVQLVRTALEASDWTAADKRALADMLEAWLPKTVAPWDAKEQRKKLKFAALRGIG